MHTVGFIPARLDSERLPRKLLLAETGKPLLQHTWEAASQAKTLESLTVATDSPEIADAVRQFGGRAVLTGTHSSGTDRIAEVVKRSHPGVDIVVNIQGDEPEIDPVSIDRVVQTLIDSPHAQMSTAATPIRRAEVRDSRSCVKVVRAFDGRALYFSRNVIPYCTSPDPDGLLLTDSPWLLHLGLYAYRRDFLLTLSALRASPLEQLERLEQLRALESGALIQVAVVEHHNVGIDTAENYARFVERSRPR
jgi:3-deoxy-manno-octulosonate cytidylyltransferase (CMP-KDO synthetase)